MHSVSSEIELFCVETSTGRSIVQGTHGISSTVSTNLTMEEKTHQILADSPLRIRSFGFFVCFFPRYSQIQRKQRTPCSPVAHNTRISRNDCPFSILHKPITASIYPIIYCAVPCRASLQSVVEAEDTVVDVILARPAAHEVKELAKV